MTRRRALGWGCAGGVLLVTLLAVGVALVRAPLPPSPRGPEPGRTLFQAHCASCHGPAGRGDSWRARLLLLRPGDLSRPAMATLSDQYLAELVRYGGSTFGKPGMPSFGFVLRDAQIEAVIQYVRSLPRAPRDVGRGTPPAPQAGG
jgi:mono/diheme cytochrome c family protein